MLNVSICRRMLNESDRMLNVSICPCVGKIMVLEKTSFGGHKWPHLRCNYTPLFVMDYSFGEQQMAESEMYLYAFVWGGLFF